MANEITWKLEHEKISPFIVTLRNTGRHRNNGKRPFII